MYKPLNTTKKKNDTPTNVTCPRSAQVNKVSFK